jgi:hypothetical protein
VASRASNNSQEARSIAAEARGKASRLESEAGARRFAAELAAKAHNAKVEAAEGRPWPVGPEIRTIHLKDNNIVGVNRDESK